MVRRREACENWDDKPYQACDAEDECHTSCITSSEPWTDECDAGAGGHKWYRDILGDWSDHKCREWTRGWLDTLGKSDDAPLFLIRNNLLDDSLLRRFNNRHENHPWDDTSDEEDDRGIHGEKYTHEPGHHIESDECADGIFTYSTLWDYGSSYDKGKAEKAPHDSPGLYWDERETVGIHERHKDSTKEIIKCHEKYER